VFGQRKEEEIRKDLEMMQRENSQLVQPQLKALNDEIIEVKDECERYAATAGKLEEATTEIQQKIEALNKESAEAEEEQTMLQKELAKLRGDPARLKYVFTLHVMSCQCFLLISPLCVCAVSKRTP